MKKRNDKLKIEEIFLLISSGFGKYLNAEYINKELGFELLETNKKL